MGSELLSFASLPTPPNTIREGLVADHDVIGSVLAETIAQAGLPPGGPAPVIQVAVPGQSVVVRLMPVPTGMPPEELADVVAQEAINHVPFPVSEANLDWSIMPATERTDADGVRRVDVILAAVQRSVVDSYWKMAEVAGVKLGKIDSSFLATIRGLVFANYLQADDRLMMIVNIRQDATDINLVKSAMPLFSRSVLLGLETLGEAISRSLEIHLDEALKLMPQIQLLGMTAVDPRLGQAAQIVRTVFGDITDEVARSLEFYRSQIGEVQVNQILLCGPGTVIPEVDQFIASRLNVPCEVVNPLRHVVYDPVLVPEQRRSSLTMSVGNVVDPTWNQVVTVNLDLNKEGPSAGALEGIEARPTVEVFTQETKWFTPALVVGIAFLVITGALWAFFSQYDVPKKQAEIANIDTRMEQEKKQLQDISKLKEANAALLRKKAVLDEIIKHVHPLAAVLQAIRINTPTGVQLSKVLVTGDTVQVEGHSVDFTRVSHLALNLQGSDVLSDSAVAWARRESSSGGDPRIIDFSVVARINQTGATPKIAAQANR